MAVAHLYLINYFSKGGTTEESFSFPFIFRNFSGRRGKDPRGFGQAQCYSSGGAPAAAVAKLETLSRRK